MEESTAKTAEINNPEHEQLIEVLKFTPCTYKIRLWGYGGEHVMGTVDRKIYDYFRQRRLSVPDFAWDDEYVDTHNIPEDMWPFTPGSWHDCDDIGHVWGVDRSSGTLQIEDEKGDVVYERSLDDIDGCDVGLSTEDEVWIDSQRPGTVVFYGYTSDKGTFFEADLELRQPFDPERLVLKISDFDANDIIIGVEYDGEELVNDGGDTNGKSSDYAFYVAGTNQGSGYERYQDHDDIKYGLTDWFPARTRPLREGRYNIKTKDGYEYRAVWNGKNWQNEWSDQPVKIKEWQGISYNPDEHFLRSELANIEIPVLEGEETWASRVIDTGLDTMNCEHCGWSGQYNETNDWDGQVCCPECGEPINFEH